MVRINTAHGPCRVQKAADYFFESSARGVSDLSDFPFAACPLAFEVEEEDFGHFFGGMSYTSTEKAKIIGKAACSFHDSKFTVFPDFVIQV